MLKLCVALAAVVGFACAAEPNMNGDYHMSKTPKGRDDVFPMRYADYPGTVEYFDIYSPVLSSVYSQVIWTTFPTIPLPAEIVKRFAGGKPMAILGMESDQVRNTTDGEEVSVPITWTYNHHYGPNIIGEKAKIIKVLEGDPRIPVTGHPTLVEDGMVTIVVDDESQPYPTSRNFNTANGGESRKSFKGMPPGAAYIVQSPDRFQLEAMQIDTWNREKMTGAEFFPGPLPRNSLAPADAEYSGLLECPMTTRIRKVLSGAYSVRLAGRCADAVTSLEECRAALSQLTTSPPGSPINVTEVNSAALPAGCSAALRGGSAGGVAGFFNKATAASGGRPAVHCGGPNSTAARRSGSSSSSSSSSSTLVDLKVDLDDTGATITITGPATVWFGVGFNATSMNDRPWTVVVDGYGKVTERHLAFHDPGTSLPPSVTVVSNTVTGAKRTVVLTRPLAGDVFSFSSATTQYNFITALGSGPALAIHRNHTASSLAMFAVDGPSCVCAENPAPFGRGTGMLVAAGMVDGGGQQYGFTNNCHGDVLAQRNPTCDLRTYTGGVQTCRHNFLLLDADQAIPWQDQPLQYRLKFRFWFQDVGQDLKAVAPTYPRQQHQQHQVYGVARWGFTMGNAISEYDVPKCPPGTPAERCTHVLQDVGTPPASAKYLIATHHHCHAPTCLAATLYFNDTGELICTQRALYGKGTSDKFDEKGYIALPPCLFGRAADGLQPPPLIGGRPILAVFQTNATNGHHGEMAIPDLECASDWNFTES